MARCRPPKLTMAADSEITSQHATSSDDRGRHLYFWRFLGTAVSFLLFGIGALVVGAILLPLVRILPASRERKRVRARLIMRKSLRLFVAQMRATNAMTYEFQGVERLGRPGQLIVANHPSLIDVVFLIAFTPNAGCVVKQGLWRNPITRLAVTLAEYITNDPTAVMIEASAEALREGQTVIMFPEGTRTRPHQPFVFHRGAANVALRAASVLTPVYVSVEPTTLTKNEPWYRIPPRRVHFSLRVGEDIDMQPYRDMGALPASSRAFNDYLQTHFEMALGRR
jgi:1-acyl-sn-glycerol-3-phosphate acyltransferase